MTQVAKKARVLARHPGCEGKILMTNRNIQVLRGDRHNYFASPSVALPRRPGGSEPFPPLGVAAWCHCLPRLSPRRPVAEGETRPPRVTTQMAANWPAAPPPPVAGFWRRRSSGGGRRLRDAPCRDI